MPTRILIQAAALCFTGLLFFQARPADAILPSFDPNYIISDDEILDATAMTQNEIQRLLERKGSFLANYVCQSSDGRSMKASEAIYDRAVTNGISPKFIIVLLQKEQSLIEEGSPRQSQLDWAAGYGCPDGGGCNSRWQGFWKQVNSATLQFRDYMDNPHLYTYKQGETYTFSNPYGTISKEPITVTPKNQATAALYNYTPHVYNGNFNFHKLWNRYFSYKIYPDGSLLQVKGEPGVWLIDGGEKRPFLSKGALTTRFDTRRVITVAKSDLDGYEKGNPIKFPQYSLVRSPKGTIYLLVDDRKRGFKDGNALRTIGINPEEIVDASWEDLSYYAEGVPITASTTHITGALLQDRKTGGVFYVRDNIKHPVWDRTLLLIKFKRKKPVPAAPGELEKYATGDPVKFDDGELLRTADSPAVYVITGGLKRPITSGALFEKLGYSWQNVIFAPAKIVALYPDGDPMIDPSEQEALNEPVPAAEASESSTTSASSTLPAA